MPLPMGVMNTPGAMVITLILYFPRSLAMGRVIPMMAPLEAEQMVCPFCPSIPATLATLIMTPLYPFSSGCSDIILAAYLDILKVPITLIFRTLFMTSLEATPFEYIRLPAAMMPAELTTAFTLPQVFLANSNKPLTFYSLDTSVLQNDSLCFWASASPSQMLRSAMTTLAPIEASNKTVASPKPEAPPVTIATKLLSIFIS